MLPSLVALSIDGALDYMQYDLTEHVDGPREVILEHIEDPRLPFDLQMILHDVNGPADQYERVYEHPHRIDLSFRGEPYHIERLLVHHYTLHTPKLFLSTGAQLFRASLFLALANAGYGIMTTHLLADGRMRVNFTSRIVECKTPFASQTWEIVPEGALVTSFRLPFTVGDRKLLRQDSTGKNTLSLQDSIAVERKEVFDDYLDGVTRVIVDWAEQTFGAAVQSRSVPNVLARSVTMTWRVVNKSLLSLSKTSRRLHAATANLVA
jgi:hypothetical protein